MPPFTETFLLHRFEEPTFCSRVTTESQICFKQFPKRKGRWPERGPDMDIGWGIYLKDDYSPKKIWV